MGKSGITWCIIHKDIHKTANSPGFSTVENVDNSPVHSEKMGKIPSYILWTVIKLSTRYRRYPHPSTIIHDLSTSCETRKSPE